MSQISMFDLGANERYKIRKPIRLIELFAGIGSQAKALRNLGANFEHYRICEFDKYAVQSYNEVHGTNFETSDITKITAEDLGITETDKYCYIMTYSFPCQDLSIAGKQSGMARDSGTRSGLLWEVERLLGEITELPQILLMENVPQVHGKKNIDSFKEWCAFLENKGYKNYWKDLNAKNYGIPQNRNRTFMVSVLGNYYYDFPKEIPLKLRLKDMLEKEVDEKYYLSDKQIEKNGVIPTLCARDYKDPKLVKVAQLDGFESSNRIYDANGLCPTIDTMGGGNREPKIVDDLYNNREPREYGDTAPTLRIGGGRLKVVESYRIRKLTPKECWRLMGFTDSDFDKAKASGVSNSQLYKQAGNSIVVNVLMAIFRELL